MPDVVQPNHTSVVVASPNQDINVRITGTRDVEIWFRTDAFHHYHEESLSRHLTDLLANGWKAYRQRFAEAQRRARALSIDEYTDLQRPSDDPQHRRYEQALDTLESTGTAADGAIRIRTEGLARWQVSIAAGALHRLGEDRFVAEFHDAVKALVADRELRVTMLKAEHFDLGLPREWRELTERLLRARPTDR